MGALFYRWEDPAAEVLDKQTQMDGYDAAGNKMLEELEHGRARPSADAFSINHSNHRGHLKPGKLLMEQAGSELTEVHRR